MDIVIKKEVALLLGFIDQKILINNQLKNSNSSFKFWKLNIRFFLILNKIIKPKIGIVIPNDKPATNPIIGNKNRKK